MARFDIQYIRRPVTIHKHECPPEGGKKECATACDLEWLPRHEKAWRDLMWLVAHATGKRISVLRTIKYIHEHLLDLDYFFVLTRRPLYKVFKVLT